jgi:hypothetical protein
MERERERERMMERMIFPLGTEENSLYVLNVWPLYIYSYWWHCGLNSGLYIFKAVLYHLSQIFMHAILLWFFFGDGGSQELFAQAGLKLQSSLHLSFPSS